MPKLKLMQQGNERMKSLILTVGMWALLLQKLSLLAQP